MEHVYDLTGGDDDPIRQALLSHPGTEPGARVRRVLLIAEFVDDDGSRWLAGFSDCSPWEGEGMLRYALRNGLHYPGGFEDEEDED